MGGKGRILYWRREKKQSNTSVSPTRDGECSMKTRGKQTGDGYFNAL